MALLSTARTLAGLAVGVVRRAKVQERGGMRKRGLREEDWGGKGRGKDGVEGGEREAMRKQNPNPAKEDRQEKRKKTGAK